MAYEPDRRGFGLAALAFLTLGAGQGRHLFAEGPAAASGFQPRGFALPTIDPPPPLTTPLSFPPRIALLMPDAMSPGGAHVIFQSDEAGEYIPSMSLTKMPLVDHILARFPNGLPERLRNTVARTLIISDNHCANQLAETYLGGLQSAVRILNWEARNSLGLRHTRFVSPSGLPVGQDRGHTTALDMARMLLLIDQRWKDHPDYRPISRREGVFASLIPSTRNNHSVGYRDLPSYCQFVKSGTGNMGEWQDKNNDDRDDINDGESGRNGIFYLEFPGYPRLYGAVMRATDGTLFAQIKHVAEYMNDRLATGLVLSRSSPAQSPHIG